MGCACHAGQPPTTDAASSIDTRLQAALTHASAGNGLSYYMLPASDDYDNIPQDPKNPITQAKVDLGRFLFHETAFGSVPKLATSEATYSCASCHHAAAGFQAGVVQGIGEGGLGFGRHGEGRVLDAHYPRDSVDVQPIRTPSVLHVAYQTNMLWNGGLGVGGVNRGLKYAWMPNSPLAFNRLGFDGIETQAIASLKTHRLNVEQLLVKEPTYRPLFDAAFSAVATDRRYTRRTAGLALGAYQRTLVANRAPFQTWLRGDRAAMSRAEKEGAILFFGKAKCFQCHNGPALSSMRFEALGMKDLYQNPVAINSARDSVHNFGRGGFNGRREHMHAFKVPQLYNLADVGFFGHGASFTSIDAVVRYKNVAQPENANVPTDVLSTQFVPLGLTDREISLLTVFLTSALRDSTLARYVPDRLPSGQCFPNNDVKSRLELGCQ